MYTPDQQTLMEPKQTFHSNCMKFSLIIVSIINVVLGLGGLVLLFLMVSHKNIQTFFQLRTQHCHDECIHEEINYALQSLSVYEAILMPFNIFVFVETAVRSIDKDGKRQRILCFIQLLLIVAMSPFFVYPFYYSNTRAGMPFPLFGGEFAMFGL